MCKLGAAGGTDASVKSLTEGSNLLLLKACRRLLLGTKQPDPDIDDIAANKSTDVHFNTDGEITIDENDDDGDDNDDDNNNSEIKIEDISENQPAKSRKHNKPLNISAIQFNDLESAHWAVEGLAYLTMNADVKEEIIEDCGLVRALLLFAEVSYTFLYFIDSHFTLSIVIYINLLCDLSAKFISICLVACKLS